MPTQISRVPQTNMKTKSFTATLLAFAFALFAANSAFGITLTGISVAAQTGTLTYGTAGSATYSVSFSKSGNGNTTVTNLGVSSLPPNIIASWSSTTTVGTGNFAPTNVTLTITTTAGALPTNSFSFTVTNASVTTVTGTGSLLIGTAALTVTGVTANNKVYDKTTSATLNTASAALSGLIGSDLVTLGGTPSGVFASTPVGTGVAVNITGYSVSGANAGYYTFTQPTGVTANITAKPLTVSGLTAANRNYNGTTTATFTGTAALQATEAAGTGTNTDGKPYTGDTLSLSGTATGTFADKNAAINKPVTITGGTTLGGSASANYSLTFATNLTANIAATNITVTAITNTKPYDGTTNAAANPTVTPATGIQTGDTEGFSEGYATANVGTNNKTLVPFGSVTDGNSGTNYNVTFVNVNTGTITALPLTISGVTVSNKVYDRTFTAGVNTNSASLVGIVGADVINLGGNVTGTFASSNVAPSIAVTVAGFSLSGANAGNYTVTQPSGFTAAITAAPLTITSGITAANKNYNGTTATTITTNNVVLSGVISGDTINIRTNGYTAVFADKNAGTNKNVTVTILNLGGNNATNNYSVTPLVVTANIAATNITVTATTNTKIYDGTTAVTNAPTLSANAIQTGDTNGFSEAYSTATVGTANKTIIPSGAVNDGNGGANYIVSLVNLTTATISAKALTVTGVTAADKVYDRTFAATLNTNSAALVGVISPDVVNLGGTPTGTFASSNSANGIVVTGTGLALTGTDAGNYSLTVPTSSANITKATVTVQQNSMANAFAKALKK